MTKANDIPPKELKIGMCVYCQAVGAFSDEHVILRAFGKFYDESGAELVLQDRVCKACNESFSGFERRHSQQSFDAFFRNQAKVKGRRPKKGKPNPYKAKPDGSRPIIVKGRPPGAKHDIYMQMDPVSGAKEQTSAQFIHPKTSELSSVELTPSLTREDFVKNLRAAGYEDGVELSIYYQPEEAAWVEKLFSKVNAKFNPPPAPYELRAYVEGGYRKEDLRSVAKIAFNYVMKFNQIGLTGHEVCFEGLKTFIRHGVGGMFEFCSVPILFLDSSQTATPCHIISFEVTSGKDLLVRMHLFASNRNESPVHVVRLGQSPFALDLPKANTRHLFEIDVGPTDSGKVRT